MNAGVRLNAADEKPGPVNESGNPRTAAEMRAMAEQAEAEAAEAEALAAAARARARALQLRRQAELVETTEADKAQTEEPADAAVEIQSVTEAQDIPTETVQTEESTGDSFAPGGSDVASDLAEGAADVPRDVTSDIADDKPASYRGWRRRPKLATLAGILAVIVIVASLIASALMVLKHRDASQQRQRTAEFAAAAREGVVTLTSLDFNDAKAGVQRIIDDSTGSFRDDFAKMASDFTKVVEESKVIEQGTVQAVAVDREKMTKDSAVVLVASKSEVTNAAGAKQDPRTFRLVVTITRDGDQLKMSKVEFVP
jgi:Mce-associated membrane protein